MAFTTEFIRTNDQDVTFAVAFRLSSGKVYVGGYVGRNDDGGWWATHVANHHFIDAGDGYRTRLAARDAIIRREMP